MKKVVLIGGAPTSGKSYLARKMSESLKLPWISTDVVREWMRKISDLTKYPELSRFTYEEGAAERYLTTHSPEKIVEEQNIESVDVWKGVGALIEADYVWTNFIVEGVAVLPKLVSEAKFEGTEIKPIFLIEENEERIRDIVYKRGLWDDANKYPDSVKDIEIKWASLFNKWIKSEADKYGYRRVIIDNENNYVEKVIQEIAKWINN